MKRHISFPSIDQYKTVVHNLRNNLYYVGKDEQGEPIYNYSKVLPTVTFRGTIKLHGTNSGVAYSTPDGLWAQSRTNIITPQKDNAGFAFFVENRRNVFISLIKEFSEKYAINLDENIITLYGEWAGSGIQKNVGINQIEKSFFLFGVKVSPLEPSEKEVSKWYDYSFLESKDNKIYNILNYETYSIDIDLNKPELAQNLLLEITTKVEECCPVTRSFGFEGIGEGVVWEYISPETNVRYLFKVKGEKHAGKSKVTTLKSVDDQRINQLMSLANSVTPTWRLDQMLTEACDLNNGGIIEKNKIPQYIKLVINDIVKEETALLVENQAEPKDIAKYVTVIAREYFFMREQQI